MEFIRNYKFLSPRQKRVIGGAVAIGLLVIAGGVSLGVRQCTSEGGPPATRLDDSEQQALTQLREAFFAVMTELTAEPPVNRVDDAVNKLALAKGEAFGQSRVDQTPVKFNPDKAEWLANRGGGPMGGMVLVVAPAPPSYRARKVTMIGISTGGLPVEISTGSEPAWLATAVTAPAP